MSPLSTAQVAELVGVNRATLEEWLTKRKFRPPRAVLIGKKVYRLWTDRDVARIRVYKEKFYRKGRGRKRRTS
ncbi:MAG: MerR family transcriptional regulator [Terriglobales bacterium]